MWKVFLAKFWGWMPIMDTKVLHALAIEVFTDAADNTKLGWGAWLPHLGFQMYGQWEEDFFQKFQLSIDFLELYAHLATIIIWAPHPTDCAILFQLDNTPTVFVLRNKFSDSNQMPFLLHFLTLFCMTHNITFSISGLSCLKARCHHILAFDTKQPDSAAFHLHAKGLFLLAHKNNSHSVYNRAWSIFDKYCMFYDKGIYQLQEMDMVEFMAFMSLEGLAPTTIITYISGVKHHLRVRGTRDFNDSFLLKLTLTPSLQVHPHRVDRN